MNDEFIKAFCLDLAPSDLKFIATIFDKQDIGTKKLIAKLSSQSTPSLQLLPEYIAALTEMHSPDTAADLPSRALRALFALSEHASSHDVRVAMVRDGVVVVAANEDATAGGGKGKKKHNKNNIAENHNGKQNDFCLLTYLPSQVKQAYIYCD